MKGVFNNYNICNNGGLRVGLTPFSFPCFSPEYANIQELSKNLVDDINTKIDGLSRGFIWGQATEISPRITRIGIWRKKIFGHGSHGRHGQDQKNINN
mgnify:CR=1 FL=1